MRLCWSLAALSILALGITLYLFVIRGSVVPASDGRTAILLAPGERDLVLAEMRAFLQSTQTIIVSAARHDLAPAIRAAHQVGAQAQRAVPTSLMGKLPLAFKSLGLDTHRRFDQLAQNAQDLGDPTQTLSELGDLMNNCIACHAAYRIDPAQP
ncbi:MAG: hypothetical protein WCA32_22845 [Chromatiaceae bacterium]